MKNIYTQNPSRLNFDPLDLIFERLLAQPLKQENPASNLASMDLFEDNSHFHAQIDLPGVVKENVKVKIQGHLLQVSAKRITGSSESLFEREITLPDGAPNQEIKASFENGVLHIAITKADNIQARTISVS